MVVRYSAGALTKEEKRIVRALLDRGSRNQDIQALINTGRSHTINSARITEVKRNKNQQAAPEQELAHFQKKKQSFDPETGLNIYDDERLIRAREAMILAVQGFNSAGLKFKTELFAVLANIAWTYLLHEYFRRKNVKIEDKSGMSLLLSNMLDRDDCPLSRGAKDNLKALKIIRDEVEHKILGDNDSRYLSLFQACCLNFEKNICELFDQRLSLKRDLSFALQFSKLNFEQTTEAEKYEFPAHIKAIDARLYEGKTDDQLLDLDYQFRVIYTFDSAAKSNSHIEFVLPDSADGKEIRSVLVKYKLSDEMYPHKAGVVTSLVKEKSRVQFTSRNHTQAWKLYKARPATNSKSPENTNKDYCIYNKAHSDYTYSQKWVDFLVQEIATKENFEKIRSFKT